MTMDTMWYSQGGFRPEKRPSTQAARDCTKGDKMDK